MNVRRVFLTAALVVSAFPLAGCNDDDSGNAPPSTGTAMSGTSTDESGDSGIVSLIGLSLPLTSSNAVLAQDPGTPLTGQLRLAGQPAVPLTGTFNAEAGTISFGSANGAFKLSGTATGTMASGTGT